MKALITKLLSCLLVVCMLVPVFASCDNDDTQQNESQEPSKEIHQTTQTDGGEQNTSKNNSNSNNNSGGENDGSFTYVSCEGGYAVDKFIGTESDVDRWVIDCDTSVTAAILRTNTVGVGDSAFSGCTSLASIIIPNNVKNIGSSAFSGCTELKSITFEDTSTWYRTDNFADLSEQTKGVETDVSNASANATYFKDTYGNYYWYKK